MNSEHRNPETSPIVQVYRETVYRDEGKVSLIPLELVIFALKVLTQTQKDMRT